MTARTGSAALRASCFRSIGIKLLFILFCARCRWRAGARRGRAPRAARRGRRQLAGWARNGRGRCRRWGRGAHAGRAPPRAARPHRTSATGPRRSHDRAAGQCGIGPRISILARAALLVSRTAPQSARSTVGARLKLSRAHTSDPRCGGAAAGAPPRGRCHGRCAASPGSSRTSQPRLGRHCHRRRPAWTAHTPQRLWLRVHQLGGRRRSALKSSTRGASSRAAPAPPPVSLAISSCFLRARTAALIVS